MTKSSESWRNRYFEIADEKSDNALSLESKQAIIDGMEWELRDCKQLVSDLFKTTSAALSRSARTEFEERIRQMGIEL